MNRFLTGILVALLMSCMPAYAGVLVTKVDIATDGSGAFTATTAAMQGEVHSYRLVQGGAALDAGADLDIVGADSGIVVSNHDNIAAGTYAPRQATHGVDGAAALYAAGGTAVFTPIAVNERLTVTIANGGASKAATLWLVLKT
jgi:hypothetical protein